MNNMNSHLHIALVDNDRFVLSAFGQYLVMVGMSVVWTATSSKKALTLYASQSKPLDALIVDLQLEDESGLSLVKQIRARNAHLPIIILSAFSPEKYASLARAAGAQAFIGKDNPATVARVVSEVAHGQTFSLGTLTFLSPKNAHLQLLKETNNGVSALSPTETTIIKLVSRGKTNQQIADELDISPESVKTHLKRAFAKTDSKNRAELAAKWLNYKQGLIK